jgi:hypothetical protein
MKKEILPENEWFRHQDICLVSTLLCYGRIIEAIDRQDPQKVVFSIKRDEKLDELIQNYWTNQLLVEPKAFFSYLKEIKTRIYNN